MDLQQRLDNDNVDGYGVPIPIDSDGPLHEITWSMDKDEGSSINEIKANNIEPLPEPLIDIPKDVKNSVMLHL